MLTAQGEKQQQQERKQQEHHNALIARQKDIENVLKYQTNNTENIKKLYSGLVSQKQYLELVSVLQDEKQKEHEKMFTAQGEKQQEH